MVEAGDLRVVIEGITKIQRHRQGTDVALLVRDWLCLAVPEHRLLHRSCAQFSSKELTRHHVTWCLHVVLGDPRMKTGR